MSMPMAAVATPQEAAAGPDDGAEMVVIGRRLHAWRGAIVAKRGRPLCRVLVSTGDRAIDRIGCAAMLRCLAAVRPGAAGAGDAADLSQRMNACVAVDRERLVRAPIAARQR